MDRTRAVEVLRDAGLHADVRNDGSIRGYVQRDTSGVVPLYLGSFAITPLESESWFFESFAAGVPATDREIEFATLEEAVRAAIRINAP